ncbi:hypothetical protein EV424DRAFT_1542205 [Suillus variegatus]|nr:hypothetical protein EV424DRAFT_1542205 [Suillus variegatus]
MESQASKTPDKTTLGTSYAFSRKFNTRNLEYYWYPLWAQVLSDLVKAAPALLVAPQFYTWIPNPADDTSIEVEVEETEDGDDPDEFKVIEEIAQGPQDNLTTAEDESGAVDSLGTIPEKNSRGAIADFAIVHLSPRASSPGDSARYGGWKIDVASVKLIVEVKRSASRSLKGDLLDAEVIKIMKEATADLVKQAAYIFAC